MLNLKPALARVYLPPDANCFLSTVAHCLRAKDYINLMVGSKQPTPVWLSPEEADKVSCFSPIRAHILTWDDQHCIAGASIWKFASVEDGKNPDVVLVGIGVEVTFEVIAAAALLRKVAPHLRVRVVNVTDLMILGPEGSHPHALHDADWDNLFTPDRPVHFNYHGYPQELRGLLFGRAGCAGRVTIEGYREEGTTTSALDMMLQNCTSRYHVAEYAVRGGSKANETVRVRSHEIISELRHLAEKDKEYIYANGAGECSFVFAVTVSDATFIDPAGTFDVPKF